MAGEGDLASFLERGRFAKSRSPEELKLDLKRLCASLARLEQEDAQDQETQRQLDKLVSILSQGFLVDHYKEEIKLLTACALAESFRLAESPLAHKQSLLAVLS
jgi:hypothetical protein